MSEIRTKAGDAGGWLSEPMAGPRAGTADLESIRKFDNQWALSAIGLSEASRLCLRVVLHASPAVSPWPTVETSTMNVDHHGDITKRFPG